MVVLVMAALLAVAGPFALSMYLSDREARHFRDSATARLAAEGALAHAVALLRRTDDAEEKSARWGPPWDTPRYDTDDEFVVGFRFPRKSRVALKQRGVALDDPRGVIWSARIEDEQGKINLGSARAALIRNLVGSATLTERLRASDRVMLLDDATFFHDDGNPKTVDGHVRVGGELVSYTRATEEALWGLRRNVDGSLDSIPTHRQGSVVYDALADRVTRYLATHEIRTPYELKRVLPPEDFERILPFVTVYSHTASGSGWYRRQRITHDFDEEAEVISVRDAKGYGPGTRVRFLVEKEPMPDEYMNRVKELKKTKSFWEIALDDTVGFERPDDARVYVEAARPHPVNVNTARYEVLAELFMGVGFRTYDGVTRLEAERLADFSFRYVRGQLLVPMGGGIVESEPLKSRNDVQRMFAAAKEMGAAGEGFTGRKVAALVANLTVPTQTGLASSTTTFCFKSYGEFTIEAAGVVNTPTGEESARYVVRQLVRFPRLEPYEDGTGAYWASYGRLVVRKVEIVDY
jgi:hypothetical protein